MINKVILVGRIGKITEQEKSLRVSFATRDGDDTTWHLCYIGGQSKMEALKKIAEVGDMFYIDGTIRYNKEGRGIILVDNFRLLYKKKKQGAEEETQEGNVEYFPF